MGDASKYFDKSEFTCKCGCGVTKVDRALLERLDQLREAVGRPLVIASGYRCPAHNAAEGGVSDSAHTLGLAVDIKIGSGQERFDLLSRILRGYFFKRVGIAKTFIHVDLDESKPQTVAWLYS